MNKLGVYIATHNNPVFLRSCLLQLEAQTRRPDVIAIHENGHDKPYLNWSCADILHRIKGTSEIIHDHTPGILDAPFFHYLPLKRLFERGCYLFTKLDHDDLFYSWHLRDLHRAYEHHRVLDESRWVGNSRADVVILNPSGYVYRSNVDFGQFNPIGGMSDTFMFDRLVAEQYLEDMRARAGQGWADDCVLAKDTLPKFKGVLQGNGTPISTVYVSHGRNTSTSHWVRQTPPELT